MFLTFVVKTDPVLHTYHITINVLAILHLMRKGSKLDSNSQDIPIIQDMSKKTDNISSERVMKINYNNFRSDNIFLSYPETTLGRIGINSKIPCILIRRQWRKLQFKRRRLNMISMYINVDGNIMWM